MQEMHSLKLIFVLNLVILLAQIEGEKACYEEERKGLLELKPFLKIQEESGSDHLLSSWVDDPRSDCCGWERVTCNSTTGRVVKLELSRFDMEESEMELSSFPCYSSFYLNLTLFQSFKELKALNLSWNCITWEETPGLLRLQQLETLDLSGNGLTSSHLQSLRKLKSLKILILKDNSFDGSFPARELSAFKNLETLDLSDNLLSGCGNMHDDSRSLVCDNYSDSGNFSKLRHVMLNGNSFTSLHIMRFMGSIPSLLTLDLSSNQMGLQDTLSYRDLITFGRLEVLDLGDNRLDGYIPRNIGNLSSLKELYLAENFFKGSLPVPGFCELRRLQVLDIYYNSFEGTLPPCLSNLTSFKILDLHDNLFSGPIAPISIQSQKLLQFIDISYNDFEGSISFSWLYNHSKLEVLILESSGNNLQIDNDNQAGIPLFQLKALRLSNCNMKNAPHFLLNQHRLIWLDISHNKLNGALPFWLLENNTDLTFLNLRNNSFVGELYPLTRHPVRSMVYLDVSYNHVEGHLPKDLGTMLPNLQYLNLSYNSFEGEFPPSFGVMRKLLLLDLSFNNLSGEFPEELTKYCTGLVGLMLDNNKFHGEFFSNHFFSTDMRVLKLGSNEFSGSLTTNKEFYNGMEIFDVSNNKMTGTIPNGIDASILLLQNNSFEGQVPCEGFFLAKVVDISLNFLSGPLPSCLSSFNVMLLNLRDNRLSGNVPAQIGILTGLRILLLGNNHFDGLIPRQVCRLRELSIMDLSNNSFSGSIPSCFNNVAFGNDSHEVFLNYTFYYWPNIGVDFYGIVIPLEDIYDYSSFWDSIDFDAKYVYKVDFLTKNCFLSYKGDILKYMSGLDLSYNNLTGDIPPSLGKLTSLHALNLSHNHLTGIIPVSLSNLSQVESLDFSYNRLNGKIPSEFVDLNFLAVFSVAHNNLSGRIPEKGQFATFGISSYEGNPFLSGLPSEKNRSKVVDRSLRPQHKTEEKWYEIDGTCFSASFVATYCVFLLTLGSVLYINPYWRMRWFYYIEKFIHGCYYLAG